MKYFENDDRINVIDTTNHRFYFYFIICLKTSILIRFYNESLEAMQKSAMTFDVLLNHHISKTAGKKCYEWYHKN